MSSPLISLLLTLSRTSIAIMLKQVSVIKTCDTWRIYKTMKFALYIFIVFVTLSHYFLDERWKCMFSLWHEHNMHTFFKLFALRIWTVDRTKSNDSINFKTNTSKQSIEIVPFEKCMGKVNATAAEKPWKSIRREIYICSLENIFPLKNSMNLLRCKSAKASEFVQSQIIWYARQVKKNKKWNAFLQSTKKQRKKPDAFKTLSLMIFYVGIFEWRLSDGQIKQFGVFCLFLSCDISYQLFIKFIVSDKHCQSHICIQIFQLKKEEKKTFFLLIRLHH